MEQLASLAEVAVVLGANVQSGQVVRVTAAVEQVAVVQAIADAAYRRGARFVEAQLALPGLQRSLILNGPTEAYIPAWADAAVYGLDSVGGALIEVTGPPAPGLLDDLDPVLVDRAQPPFSQAWREVEHRVNNTIVPGPHAGWAQMRYPDLAPDQALTALWRDIAIATRLDTSDPVTDWRARFAELTDRAETLSELRLDAIQLHGPGTDLTIGLLPGVRWDGPTNISQRGVLHAWNIPSEEIFTSPDPMRVDGFVRLTRPAVVGGALIRDVTLTFRDGEVIDVVGDASVEHLQAFVRRDPGTRRVGELALVDAESAVARIEQPFGTMLLDENVAAHLALGFGFPELADDQTRARINTSADHLDLTIGSPEIDITGLATAESQELPLIRHGQWVLQASQR
jgi:aminopeptidase